MKGELNMKKNHGRLLSMALSGAMVVSSLSMTVPMTALAAEGTKKATITFTKPASITNEWAADYANPILVMESLSTDTDADSQERLKTAHLPDAAAEGGIEAAFATSPLTEGKMLVWTNSVDKKDYSSAKTFDDVAVEGAAGSKTATLSANVVTKKINIKSNLADGTQGSAAVPTEKNYLENLGDKIADPTKLGYSFEGWSVYTGTTDPSPATAEIKNNSVSEETAATTSETIDTAYKTAGYTGDVNLTAIWKGATIAVTVDNDGATSGDVASFNKSYTTALSNEFADPVKSYYTFKGWDIYKTVGGSSDKDVEITPSMSAADQSKAIDDAYKAVGYADITMKAIWIENEYTITFDDNGMDTGSLPDPKTVKGSQMSSVAIPNYVGAKPVKKGHKLYSTGTGPSVTEYAWSLKANNSGASTNAYQANAAYFSNVFNPGVSATAEEKAAYESKEATLYLNWVADKNDIVLDAQDPSITVKASDKWTAGTTVGTDDKKFKLTPQISYGESAKLPVLVDSESAVVPTGNYIYLSKGEGYTFLGWDTEVASSSHTATVVYKAGDTITLGNESITLVPVWSNSNVCKITFDADGGEGSMEDIEGIAPGTKYTLPAGEFTKEGYTYKGWATSSGQTTATVKDKAEVTVNSDLKYYAAWAPNTYTIKFYNGETLKSSAVATYNVALTSTPTIEEDGKTLLGWDTDATATSNPKYPTAASIKNLSATQDDVVSLYAVWGDKTKTVTVTYKTNSTTKGATADDGSTPIHVAKNAAQPTITVDAAGTKFAAKNGYDFVGWTEKAYADKATFEKNKDKDKTKLYEAGADFTATADDELFALYDYKTVTVSFDKNAENATGNMEDVKVVFDGTNYVIKKLEANTFKRPGYEFNGWYTLKDAGTQSANAKAAADKEENVNITAAIGTDTTLTFYAQWTPNQYLIKYDANSETTTGTVPSTSFISGTTAKLTRFTLTNSDENVTFIGWALKADATAADFTDEAKIEDVVSVVDPENNGDTITLYAVWGESSSKKVADAEAAKAEADQKADAATKDAEAAKADAAAQKDAAAKATDAANKATAAQKTAEADAAAAKTEAANQKAAADAANKSLATLTAKQKLATALTTNAGKTKKVSGSSYKTDADAGKSVAVTKGKNVKALTLKATVKIGGNTYKVRALNAKAFTGTKIRTIKIAGNYLTNIDVNAFKNTKATKITVTKASATAKKQLKAAAKAAKLKYSAKGKTVTITKK